jgi:pilus assembly protein Flp/PilA
MHKFYVLLKCDRVGATAIEYGLIAAVIGGVVITAATAFGNSLSTAYGTLGNKLTTTVNSMGS